MAQVDKLLIIDTEGGKVPREVAAILYSIKHGLVQQFSTLLPHDLTERMTQLETKDPIRFRYSHQWCMSKTIERDQLNFAYGVLNGMIAKADVIVAHNAPYDRRHLAKLGSLQFAGKPWICTIRNIFWPNYKVSYKCPTLEEVCQSQDVPYVNAHVAIHDCQMLLDCLLKLPDLEARLIRALPWAYRHMPMMQNNTNVDVEFAPPVGHIDDQTPSCAQSIKAFFANLFRWL